MDNGLKQRVVGAVVLISLAIIFLPMILDGRSNQVPKISYETETPAPPQVASNPIDLAPHAETAKKVAAAIDKDRQAVAESAPVKKEAVPTNSAANSTKETPPKDASPAAKSATTTVKNNTPNAKPVTPAVTSLAPVSEQNANPATAEVAPAWTIQVASVNSQDGAKVLRDKLLAKGHRAYIKQAGTAFRIFVGPELRKDHAETELAAIAADKEFSLKGMLLRYQP